MRLLHSIQYPLFAPVTATPPVASPGEMSKDDILDFLNKDDEPVEDEVIPVKEEKKEIPDEKKKVAKDEEEDTEEDKEGDEEEEDEDELALLEDELEEPDEEKLELTTPTSRREILKAYPDLFKKFPSLEKAYYREMEFTKIVPTIQDAKEAVEKAETLDSFNKDLSNGNLEIVLKAVHQNQKAFNKVADEYLETLARVDVKAYHHVLGNTMKHVIEHMIAEGRSSENEALQSAAVILNQFVFGSSKFTKPTKLSEEDSFKPEVDDKEAKIAEREKAFVKQRYTATNNELNTKVSKAFKATIDAYIDPKKSMPEYVRKHASREALEELETLISKDTRFRTIIDKLWERAFQDDFSPETIDKIYGAFKSKAGTLLGSVVKKARNEALKGLNKRSSDDDSRPDNESKNGDESRRRNDSKKGDESHRRNDSGKKVPHGMSSYEYLMSDD